MKIIRVFPRRTSFTPTDEYAFIGDPPMFIPRDADEVHISVCFTWDIDEGQRLVESWGRYYQKVKIGGPAFKQDFEDIKHGFKAGMYVKSGVTFTSRGCGKRCPWCLVYKECSILYVYDNFEPGYIIQDNNFLQTPYGHQQKVFKMLREINKPAVFSGGLDTDYLQYYIVTQFKDIKIGQIFFSADTWERITPLENAIQDFDFLPRDKIRCYVLLAFNGEDIESCEARLERVWELGAIPFAQLYQPPDHYIKYSKEWRDLARTWSRPAAMKAIHKNEKLV